MSNPLAKHWHTQDKGECDGQLEAAETRRAIQPWQPRRDLMTHAAAARVLPDFAEPAHRVISLVVRRLQGNQTFPPMVPVVRLQTLLNQPVV